MTEIVGHQPVLKLREKSRADATKRDYQHLETCCRAQFNGNFAERDAGKAAGGDAGKFTCSWEPGERKCRVSSERQVQPMTEVPVSVLVIDDDLSFQETLGVVLGVRLGVLSRPAMTGSEGLSAFEEHRPTLVLFDLRLPDLDGLRVAQSLPARARFVLVSAFLEENDAIDAMRLGALEVIDRHIGLAIEDVMDTVRKYLIERPYTTARIDPYATPDRWARHVLAGCWSPHDLTSLDVWAHHIGVSYSSLRDLCSRINIPAADARDLMRTLRAVIWSQSHNAPAEVFLNVGDSRTLKSLMDRAGLSRIKGQPSVREFFTRQQFLPQDNHGVRVLNHLAQYF